MTFDYSGKILIQFHGHQFRQLHQIPLQLTFCLSDIGRIIFQSQNYCLKSLALVVLVLPSSYVCLSNQFTIIKVINSRLRWASLAITKILLLYSSASINYYGLWIECGLAMVPLFDFIQLRAA